MTEGLIVFKLPELSRSCSMESCYIVIWRVFKKILFIRALYFERKKESENKFWTFVLTCYTWNKVNTNWRIWYYLKTTVRKFNNSNIGAVNVIQKKFVYLLEIKSKVHLKLERYCSKFILLSFHLTIIQLFIST